MKIEYDEEKDMLPIQVNVEAIPKSIVISQSEPKRCFYNSYVVAKENSNIEIIEGVGIIISKDNSAKAFPHVWNRVDDKYFDVTVNDSIDLSKNIVELKYLKVKSYLVSDFKDGDNLGFGVETENFVKDINNNIK